MNAVTQLLTHLSVDPFRLNDFVRNPGPFIAAAGIAPEELPRLWRTAETGADETWVRCAACADPGYDPLPDPEVPEADMPGQADTEPAPDAPGVQTEVPDPAP